MSRNLRNNSSAPPIYPLPKQPRVNMAVSGAGEGAGALEVAEPVVIWNENPLTGNFYPGTVAGQNIFLEKKKGLATAEQLPLSNASAKDRGIFENERTAHGNCGHRSPNYVHSRGWKITDESHS